MILCHISIFIFAMVVLEIPRNRMPCRIQILPLAAFRHAMPNLPTHFLVSTYITPY